MGGLAMNIFTTRLLGIIRVSLGLLAPISAFADEGDRWSEEISYIKSHGVSVIENGNGTASIVLETAFAANRAPNMRLYLGRDGVANPSVNLGTVAKIRGLQVFEAPASINLAEFNELHILNADDGTSLGVAPLK